MATLSDRIQVRLQALTQTFTAQLPQRMQDIAEAARASLAGDSSQKALKTFRNHVHKLAGAAASFGFHHVTACAKKLEHVLDGALTDGEELDSSVQRRIRMLVSELGEATRMRQAAAGPGADSGEELEELRSTADIAAELAAITRTGSSRTVLLRIESEKLSAELTEQLEFFGFQIVIIPSADKITDYLVDDQQVAVIADASIIVNDPAVSEMLAATKAEHETRLHTLFVSDRDDYQTRLLAVRSGGEAFFSTPADTHRLIDTVDGLTSESRETPYHVLIVDDDKEQVSYHALILQQAGMITSVVSDPENMFPVLIDTKPELILLDMYMPECSGLELATIIRQQEAFVSVPIVFLSIETDQDRHLEAISRGGDGFLIKPVKPEHLITTVRSRIERTRSMRFYMERDSLTGLLNHTHLNQSLSKEVQRAERVDRPLCFAMIDIDHFKDVNDSYGHLTGDRVLKSLARFLQDRLRKTDIIGRYGGEEFGIILFNVDMENAKRVMDSVREDFSKIEHEAGDRRFSISFSCGIAAYPEFDGPGPLTEAADGALYTAKENGRNQIAIA